MYRPNVAVVTAWCKEKYEINLFFFVWPDRVQAGEELWLDYGYVSAVAHHSHRCANHHSHFPICDPSTAVAIVAKRCGSADL